MVADVGLVLPFGSRIDGGEIAAKTIGTAGDKSFEEWLAESSLKLHAGVAATHRVCDVLQRDVGKDRGGDAAESGVGEQLLVGCRQFFRLKRPHISKVNHI